MKIAVILLSILFMGATNVASLPSLMSEGEIRTARGSGCYQLKLVPCQGGDSTGCEGMLCTFHEAQGETIPAAWKCEPTNQTGDVKQDPYDTAVTATVGQTGQNDHDVPDPENPTDPSNYYQCVVSYTCSGCEIETEQIPVPAPIPPYFYYVEIEQGYCKNAQERNTDDYDAEWQQLQVLTGEECEVAGPGTQVEEPIDP